MSDFVELGVTTNFSFLRGASHPQEFIHEASALRLPAIGIADRNTLAGVVRAHSECGNRDLAYPPRLLIGARLVFTDDTPDILVYPRDRDAYGRLCQLLTKGKRAADKGECYLTLDDLIDYSEGQLLIVMPPYRVIAITLREILDKVKQSRAEGIWLGANMLYRGDDARRLMRLQDIAAAARVPSQAGL
jgi:error-prone DNA polymerase